MAIFSPCQVFRHIYFVIMNYLAQNLTILREAAGIKPSEIPNRLGIPRTTWNSYEAEKAQPDIDRILVIADFFGVPVTDLLAKDLSKSNLNENQHDSKKQIKSNLKSNPLSNLNTQKFSSSLIVNEPETPYGNKNLEKNNVYDLDSLAAAGVALFISDGDRRKTKPALHFPWLGPGLHIRIGVAGDSMHPTIKDGDKTIATWVDEIGNLREGNAYIILDKEDGLVCKRIYRFHTKNTLEFISDNETYKPYTRHFSDILAIFRIAEVTTTDLRPEMSEFKKELRQLKREMTEIRALLPKK